MKKGYYPLKLTKVIDGDTIDAEIGGKACTIRLQDIDAPEIGQNYGDESRDFLKKWLSIADAIHVDITDKGHYGRYIGTVYISAGFGASVNVNKKMVLHGMAWTNGDKYQQEHYFAAAERKGLFQEDKPLRPDIKRQIEGKNKKFPDKKMPKA